MVTKKKVIIKDLLSEIKNVRNAARAPKLTKAKKLKLRAKVIVLRRTVKTLRNL